MPSYQSSFKLAAPVAPVGALRLDRSSGVAGLLGAEAHMVPLRIGLNLGGKRILNFRYELMDHPIITPNLAATVLAQTITTYVRGQGFQSLALQGNIKLAGPARRGDREHGGRPQRQPHRRLPGRDPPVHHPEPLRAAR